MTSEAVAPLGYADFLLQVKNQICDKLKLQLLIGEISWYKNLIIMARCKDDLEREFYLRATARFGWASKVFFTRPWFTAKLQEKTVDKTAYKTVDNALKKLPPSHRPDEQEAGVCAV